MIQNGFVALGPNVTGYPGGYPNGYLGYLRRKGWWGYRRLHLCAGSVQDGVRLDINPETRPTVLTDLELGVPFKANRGPKPLRAIQVWRKKPRPLGEWDQ